MKEYIFGERNGIYIVDLQKTLRLFKEALSFATQLGHEGKTVLFIGTKRQAQEVVAEEAARAGMYFVNQRWLGGTLTNFVTIQKSIGRFKELSALVEGGRGDELTKKELSRLDKERKKLEKNLSGIQEMQRLPDAIFVVDAGREEIAVHEARKLGIPVIAIVDTNCDPDVVDYVIPGNDDALRAIKLFTSRIADAIIAGKEMSKAAVAGPSGNGGPARKPDTDFAVEPGGAEAGGESPSEPAPPPA
jgi:small subunit ribosomal protein S2